MAQSVPSSAQILPRLLEEESMFMEKGLTLKMPGPAVYRTSPSPIFEHTAIEPVPESPFDPYKEVGDEIYDRFSPHRKSVIVADISFSGFLAPWSSTSVLAATPEVAKDFHTNGSVINTCNAVYIVLMGVSPVVWGPLSHVFGRRPVSATSLYLPFLTFHSILILDKT